MKAVLKMDLKMDKVFTDTVEAKRLDLKDRSLLFRVWGRDRPGVVAQIAGLLEAQRLYVGSITFNLVLPAQDQFEMEILAKGDGADLTLIYDRIKANHFLPPIYKPAETYLHWPTACMMHVALNTPDQEGLIAKISAIVGTPREAQTALKSGNFVHLVGLTYNSGGPEGGTAYFSARANIASQSLDVQQQIEAELLDWAQEMDIEGDLWIRDLNP